MTRKQKYLHAVAITLLCSVGIAPWFLMNPQLEDDVYLEPAYAPLDVQVQVVSPASPVIYLEAIRITAARRTSRVAKNDIIVKCRWHEHDESTGIKVCEYGRELHYPTVQ